MFLTRPGLVDIRFHADLWYLDAPLDWGGMDGRHSIRIPAGLITDLASVPKFLDWVPFLDRMGESRLPGVFHDGLYVLAELKGKGWCDDMLYTALISEGMSPFHAGLYRSAVHTFGTKFYDEDRRQGHYGEIKAGNFFNKAYYDAWIAQKDVFT